MKRNQLDELPERWTTVTLEDVATICYGRALPSNERLNDGGVPVYGSSGIVGEHHEALYEKASLIIGRKGSVGTVYLETRPFWCIDTAFYLDNVSKWVDLAFLAHALQVVDLRRLILVVGVPGINRNDLGAVKFPLPPLREQQEIVEMLREADTLRQLRQQAVQKTGDLFLSIFQSKFGDPVQNEKKWTKTTLSKTVADDCPITYGIVQPGTDTEDGVLLIRPVDLVGRVITSTHPLKRIEASIAEKYPRSMLRGGELLLSVRGQIGTLAFADESLVGSNVTRGIVPLWFRQEVLPEFIYAQLLHPSIQQLLQRMAVGIALKQVNLEELRKLELIVPTIEMQQEFSRSLQECWEVDDSLTSSLNKIQELFQSIVAQAFTGKLTVSFRIRENTQLERESLERDTSLGLIRERRFILDLDDVEDYKRLSNNIAQQLSATLAELLEIVTNENSVTQQSFPALTQMVEEIAPALPGKEERLFSLIDALFQNTQHGLRQEFVAFADAITQRILPFYQQDIETKAVLEMLLRSAKNIGAVTPHAPQAARSIRTHATPTNCIDERLEKLLTAIEQRPPYFRAFDLLHDNIGLAEATAGLYILESLGFVRRVMWEADLDAVFRLVDPTNLDDAIHMNGEAR